MENPGTSLAENVNGKCSSLLPHSSIFCKMASLVDYLTDMEPLAKIDKKIIMELSLMGSQAPQRNSPGQTLGYSHLAVIHMPNGYWYWECSWGRGGIPLWLPEWEKFGPVTESMSLGASAFNFHGSDMGIVIGENRTLNGTHPNFCQCCCVRLGRQLLPVSESLQMGWYTPWSFGEVSWVSAKLC